MEKIKARMQQPGNKKRVRILVGVLILCGVTLFLNSGSTQHAPPLSPLTFTPRHDQPVCFPHAPYGDVPPKKGQVTSTTSFGSALTNLATRSDVRRIVEIGTWFGGGSTQSFVDGLRDKAICQSNATHHCCNAFVVTFEIFKEALDYASAYHQKNPVWCLLSTAVGAELMLTPDEVPLDEKGEHYKLYYQRDLDIMTKETPRLKAVCTELEPDVVLIDGNEYTGWGEFQVTMETCRPRFLALHDTGSLKTHKIEAFIHAHPQSFSLLDQGKDQASWSIFEVQYTPGV